MPITNASLIPDLRMASVLDAGLRLLLHDEMSMRNNNSIINLGSINGTGSATSNIRFAGLDGYDEMLSYAETAVVPETVLADASAAIAVGRAAILRNISDLAVITGFSQDVDPMRLAQSMVGAYNQYFNSLAGAAIATFTSVVGTAGVDTSVDDYYDAIFALETSSVPGDYYCLLNPVQWANLQESLRGAAGAVSFMDATEEALRIKGQGFMGSFLGVDIFRSDKVVVDGAGDAHGGMWGYGALGFKTGAAANPIGAGAVISPDGSIVVEFERVSAAATTQIIGSAYVGLSILEDARGVQIRSDGT